MNKELILFKHFFLDHCEKRVVNNTIVWGAPLTLCAVWFIVYGDLMACVDVVRVLVWL